MALVGERGPELIMPSANATVIPHGPSAAIMSGGAPTVIINQTWHVGTGAQEAAQVVQAMLPKIKAETLAGVSQSLARNGTLRKQVA